MKKILLLIMLLCVGMVFADCGTITTSTTLDADLDSQGDCFILGADNIVLDGGGFTLSGHGTGTAISASGRSGVTIKNFKINGFQTAISNEDSDSSVIEGNEIGSGSNSSQSIRVADSDNVVLRANAVTVSNPESAAIYANNDRNMLMDSNRATCSASIFKVQTACVDLNRIYDSEIKGNEITFVQGIFFPSSCIRINTAQNNKYHGNTIKGYCLGLTSGSETGSEYYSNKIETEANYYNIFSRGFTFASAMNNVIRDNDVSATYNVINFNTGYGGVPAGNVVTDLKIDGNLIFSSDRLTQVIVSGNKMPSNLIPSFEGKQDLGRFFIYTYDNTPGYIQFSVKYDPGFADGNIAEDSVGLYYYNNGWHLMPGSTVDRVNHKIDVAYIKFPSNFSGNKLKMGVWAETEEDELPADACLPDCTKGDNFAYLACESNAGCQDVQVGFLDPSGTGSAIADCDQKAINETYYFLDTYCIGDMIYESYSCRQRQGVSGTIVYVNPSGRTCANGCENGACKDELQNDTAPIESTCPGSLVLICHTLENANELCVAESSVESHKGHGDYLGTCLAAEEGQEDEEETLPPQNTIPGETTEEGYEKSVMGGCSPEKVLICHKSDKKEQEICIEESAAETHLRHEDYRGPCANEKRVDKEMVLIKKDEVNTVKFDEPTIKEISFSSKKEKKNTNIVARVRKTPPPDVAEPKREVYNYVIIDHPDIDNEDISDSKIRFSVEDSWLKAQGAKKEEVMLSKYLDDSWTDLKTQFSGTIEGIHYYDAESEGFSTFAINIVKEPVPAAIDDAPETVPEKKLDGTIVPPEGDALPADDGGQRPLFDARDSGKIIFSAAVMVVSIGLMFLIFRPKKNEPKANKDIEKYGTVMKYVAQLKKKKMGEKEIREDLEKAGWDKTTIDRLLK